MTETINLLHRIADSALTQSERAQLRCQLAKKLEEAGNYEAAREAMGELWQGVGHQPNLNELDQAAVAAVLLRAGALTGWIGSCKQIEGVQGTAKDLISESIATLETFHDPEKTADALTELGFCYWREGAFDEARDVLREALRRLIGSQSETKAIALLRSAIVERTSKRLNEALLLLTEGLPLIEESNSHALKGKFYNQLGLVLRNLGTTEQRVDYIDRALIDYAAASYHFEQAGHSRYQARVENNLGFLFSTINKFTEAHEHLDRAQALFTSLRDKTHIAQVDDTRARVLLAEGRIAEAERLALSAVDALRGNDQQILLADALITYGMALSRLGRHNDARKTLQAAVEVAEIAGNSETAGLAVLTTIEELGEHLTVDELGQTYERARELLGDSRDPETMLRLTTSASRILFLVGTSTSPTSWAGFSLKEALRRYEARLIERALNDAGGVVTQAAQLLGFRNHNSLIKILNTRHRHLLSRRSPVKKRRRSLMSVVQTDEETPPISILHIEENTMVDESLKETLELEGWIVEAITEGTEALRMLKSAKPYDVLILDNELPGINGLELINQVRRLSHRKHMPIVMLSASPVEADALAAGANAFLRKPEDISAVTETIRRLLDCTSTPKSADL